ncbi:DNA primase [Qipengyuania sp. 1XM1-15A]|uniref:DNA primase n=1 Tax=Qipengyuania xiamenensis TaxID=2867237 RepID=UPI001C86FF37|nr:DNA primase [Qipengyuania xiamenensis]MBX7531726.1 DNA primase [Qipengyuania xiamenensis]
MALSPQWLDELRMRTTLSAVIGRTVRLTKAGREFKACCPFHNEKTPSFYVNDEKGFYHCFGCEAHGDAIRWLTDQRGMPFMDAVKELAAEAGMEVPAPDPRAAERAEKRASLHDVTAAAQQWYVDELGSAEGAEARAYLKRRGFSAGVVREFGFGFAPSDRQALKRALSKFDESMLIEAGMRIDVEDKDPYDRFRGRLMLPIQDTRGRVIAFGGRILDDDAYGPKYLNSPDTPLFDKGRTLYNLHRAAPAARQSGRIIVVEGYMDAIALANAGIAEAVAPLGTALTENQIELLWRQVERPILCFDGDNAGQRAAMRAIGRVLPMLRPGHSLSIVRMPAGMDPDDLIRDKGVGAMEELLSNPASLLDTLWAFERDALPLNSPEEKAGLKERLLAHVDTIQHPDIRALYKKELLERFSAYAFPPREFKPRGEWKKGGFNAAPPRLSPETAARLKHAMSGGSRDALAVAVIHGLLRFPHEIVRHEEALSRFAARDPKVGPAIDSLIAAAETLDSRAESPISLPEGLPAPPATTYFAFLDKGTDPVDAREDLAEAVSLLVERPALEAALAEATARFETDPEGAFADQQRLLKRKLEFEARLGQMASRKAASPANRESDTARSEVSDSAENMD